MKIKRIVSLLAAATLVAAPIVASAQQSQPSAPKGPPVENSGVVGPASGGGSAASAADQPEMATGQDLKGPPQRFRAWADARIAYRSILRSCPC